MAETIYQGYVIKRQPYKVFDEIITFITTQGQKISCVSMGSKRIESKNARHLFVGNYDEFQIFKSTSDDRLSKLKKAVAIRSID
ncbi:hypothetical protein FACS1894166_04200 [Bacilli bacterium]|nr:hypothetical protein FACS1894166_04200 [Bacilli bacterium]